MCNAACRHPRQIPEPPPKNNAVPIVTRLQPTIACNTYEIEGRGRTSIRDLPDIEQLWRDPSSAKKEVNGHE